MQKFQLFKYDLVKEGSGEFEQKTGVARAFEIFWLHFWKLLALNAFFILFCIPIVTIPAAVMSLTHISRLMCDEHLVFVWTDFLKAFKRNFKISIIPGLIVGAISVLTYMFISFYINNSSDMMVMVLSILYFCGVTVFYMMQPYVFVMLVTVDLPLSVIYNNAIRLTMAKLFRNLLCFIITAGVLILSALYFPITIIPAALFVFSSLIYLNTYSAWKIVKKYVIVSDETEQEDSIDYSEEY